MLGALDKEIIKRLQEDIIIEKEPFKTIAKELNVEEEKILERIKYLKNIGILKRIGAVLHHREAGFKANAMVVWCVPNEKVECIGSYLAKLSKVTHCYERITCKEWKYNLFTMIHGKTKGECEKLIEHIAKEINIKDYDILYSTRELKKSSMKYSF
ncbi:DNA-binding Lrp family transcriptional regulator [Clostridium tetanomorphum]|uniref:siroheme decarboxylase n=1 Tax=Clostridium tetanomorphum TaxID=1553 RepID=A0A923E8W8_CLOTT|nr:AsnC family transcriptional regulator [Clostridium tetanomorphum]KAJ53887.1 AsnC family transcriptional regulator [Clostridium tetanomorphum DSM 665]MBC2397402.1 Lrp/AsnC family transcriptional regulator [Clostridium tetanomorphum]MBP1862622.1 DNA-binding Lrp family transcriptional regulator [Clostridium tetanomorphum]NRS85537.1 DNA-binding Lrp family transcriptional regulator [Clostridium tetanomorphum]NRZ96452.1 DNA-binding Lrp family transcriptional regulator [Clostridium tetanomorphum]